MTSKQTALADYILCLSQSLEQTHHANDRPLYRSYLAEAAVMLALLVRDLDAKLDALIKSHARTLGYSWLVGAEEAAVSKAWRTFAEMT